MKCNPLRCFSCSPSQCLPMRSPSHSSTPPAPRPSPPSAPGLQHRANCVGGASSAYPHKTRYPNSALHRAHRAINLMPFAQGAAGGLARSRRHVQPLAPKARHDRNCTQPSHLRPIPPSPFPPDTSLLPPPLQLLATPRLSLVDSLSLASRLGFKKIDRNGQLHKCYNFTLSFTH